MKLEDSSTILIMAGIIQFGFTAKDHRLPIPSVDTDMFTRFVKAVEEDRDILGISEDRLSKLKGILDFNANAELPLIAVTKSECKIIIDAATSVAALEL